MRIAEQVYLVSPSDEEWRPVIDFTYPMNSENNWGLVDKVLRGVKHDSEYPGVFVVVNDQRATQWDYYSVAGTFDLMSDRAATLIKPFASDYFKFFPAWLNAEPYFMLKSIKRLDCLDRERSLLVPFPSSPQKFMEIKKYSFRKECISDPLVFSIPERSVLLATESIEQMVRRENLRGFQFIDTGAV